MVTSLTREGALRWGAPFLFLGWLLLLPLAQAAPSCPSGSIDERVVVKRVFDGDTVLLSDGRKVRFIGINTPEMARDRRPAEPLAEEAKRRLEQLLESSRQRLDLELGEERHDRYGRLLAYPYLPDGRSINVLLLHDGLAAALVIPPNSGHYRCHFAVEAGARRAGRGIWRTVRFKPWPSSAIPTSARGFYLLSGRVTRFHETGRSLWLHLEGGPQLRIAKKEREAFGDRLDGVVGSTVEVRGWLNYHKGRLSMTLRHPVMINRVEP